MPPPTVGDAWLAGRRFGVVIDAGSSGSRLQIYSWKDPRGMNIEKGSNLAYSLPKVEKGAQRGDDWVKKVEPGPKSFPNVIASYLTLMSLLC
jgi:golgi apyrase